MIKKNTGSLKQKQWAEDLIPGMCAAIRKHCIAYPEDSENGKNAIRFLEESNDAKWILSHRNNNPLSLIRCCSVEETK